MAAFRIVVALLPQVLILLLVGGSLDLLGGFNRTDAGFSTLIALFLVTPVATLVLLVVEIVRYILLIKRKDSARSFLMPGVAIVLFVEALAVDLYLLSQLRMH
ncbi:MAG TPA: hypothetical protein VLC73_11035 [Burkholderiales bacterium]|nr:hypothetical protein [Burkholderiales bacterium]